MAKMSEIGKPYWHIHHESLYENLIEPLQNRINYIQSTKPKHEIKIRLRLLKPVQDLTAWAEYDRVVNTAQAEYDRVVNPARAEYNRVVNPARAEYDRVVNTAQAEYNRVVNPAQAEDNRVVNTAQAEYDRVVNPAQAEYDRVMVKLHKIECPDCPWNGKTIFP